MRSVLENSRSGDFSKPVPLKISFLGWQGKIASTAVVL